MPQPGARPGASAPNRFYMYGVVARLAMLAASYELEATDPEAEVDDSGYLSDCDWLDADSAADIEARVDRIIDDPEAVARLDHWVRYYFGDTTPGSASRRFHAAVGTLMERWDRWNAPASG